MRSIQQDTDASSPTCGSHGSSMYTDWHGALPVSLVVTAQIVPALKSLSKRSTQTEATMRDTAPAVELISLALLSAERLEWSF
jgi:hypothetical protein